MLKITALALTNTKTTESGLPFRQLVALTSTFSDTVDEGVVDLRNQLNRPENPSRYNIYKRWEEDGFIIRSETGWSVPTTNVSTLKSKA